MTEAFAVVKNDQIDVCTVSDTRRAAIVNWLVVSARPRVMIFSSFTDEHIERLWEHHRRFDRSLYADVVAVTVEIKLM